MKIFLLGYMGSGKSYLGKLLAEKLKYDFIDMDKEIEKNEQSTISEIFQQKGEIYFRKIEKRTLEQLTRREDSAVISLGGGTPCYGNNMELVKETNHSASFYLKLSIANLADRLEKEKEHRPMISHLKDREKLVEFIGKHLFERSFYYNQSDHIIQCDSKSPEEIIVEIKRKLG